MEEFLNCPKCHQSVATDDYFCRNCGHNLRPRPLSTSLGSQIVLYLKTLLLPPLGIIWGFRYFRQSDTASKLVGLFAIIITIVEIIWLIQVTATTVDTANRQIYQQLKIYGL